MHFSPFTGRGKLRKLRLKNPIGYSTKTLFQADVDFSLSLNKLAARRIYFGNITIKAPVIYWEGDLRTNNLQSLTQEVSKRTKRKFEYIVTLPIHIRQIRVERGRLALNYRDLDAHATIETTPFLIRNLGSKKDSTLGKAVSTLVVRMKDNAISTIRSEPDAMLGILKGVGAGVGNLLK